MAGQGGRKRKPDHLKVVAGTDRPDRMNPAAPVASKVLPVSPSWLSERAAEKFGQLVTILDGMGLASEVDVDMLAMLASRLEEIEITTGIIEDLGRSYTTETQGGGTMYRSRPEVSQRNEAMRHAQSLLAEFGLSPASRSKVSTSLEKVGNPFADLVP